MSDGEVFPVPEAWAKKALMNADAYDAAVLRVEAHPDAYWADLGRRLDWIQPFTQVKDVSFDKADFHINWYADGVLNVAATCATAGIIVGIVALPLAIAFAIASGVKPEQGLYTAIIAGLLISLLSGSRVQIGGPTGAFIVIIYGIVQKYGYDGLVIATILSAQ